MRPRGEQRAHSPYRPQPGDRSARPGQFSTPLTTHGYTSGTAYQPDSRFWPFQTIEATGYVALALLLAAATLMWIREHAS
jgi:hypothetical protein